MKRAKSPSLFLTKVKLRWPLEGAMHHIKSERSYSVSVWVGVEVSIEQRLQRRVRGDRLGEVSLSLLAVL